MVGERRTLRSWDPRPRVPEGWGCHFVFCIVPPPPFLLRETCAGHVYVCIGPACKQWRGCEPGDDGSLDEWAPSWHAQAR